MPFFILIFIWKLNGTFGARIVLWKKPSKTLNKIPKKALKLLKAIKVADSKKEFLDKYFSRILLKI